MDAKRRKSFKKKEKSTLSPTLYRQRRTDHWVWQGEAIRGPTKGSIRDWGAGGRPN